MVRLDGGTALTTILLVVSLLLAAINRTWCVPVSSPEAVVEDMRQIPQWHCLRYRKFDLVKRCRNYRLMRRQ